MSVLESKHQTKEKTGKEEQYKERELVAISVLGYTKAARLKLLFFLENVTF